MAATESSGVTTAESTWGAVVDRIGVVTGRGPRSRPVLVEQAAHAYDMTAVRLLVAEAFSERIMRSLSPTSFGSTIFRPVTPNPAPVVDREKILHA